MYKAASIADSIGDLQNFVNDLIRTVEQVEEGHSSRVCFYDEHADGKLQRAHKMPHDRFGLSLILWSDINNLSTPSYIKYIRKANRSSPD